MMIINTRQTILNKCVRGILWHTYFCMFMQRMPSLNAMASHRLRWRIRQTPFSCPTACSTISVISLRSISDATIQQNMIGMVMPSAIILHWLRLPLAAMLQRNLSSRLTWCVQGCRLLEGVLRRLCHRVRCHRHQRHYHRRRSERQGL